MYPGVDAFFGTDLYAMEILKQAQKLGFSIPDDIQVIAYDGSSITDVSFPRLTVIRQPYEMIANAIVEVTQRLVNGENVEPEIIFDDIALIEGETTSPRGL